MGKGKKRWSDAEKAARNGEKESEDEDSEIEEMDVADIQALARSSLKSGESILGSGKAAGAEPEARGICHAPLILQKLQDIEYKVPADAKRVPWVDTLCIDGWKEMPKGVKSKDGVKLESAFLDLAGDAVKEAYRRLKVMKVPCSRPTDFYAEMLRTDSQMFRVRERAAEEQRRIKIVENRKKSQAAKKFAKNVRTKRIQDKAGEKSKTLDEIADWKKRDKEGKKNTDDQDLDDILDKQGNKRKRLDDDTTDGVEQKKKKKTGPGLKQQAKDKKWGHGGKKKWAKSNDKTSVNDMSGSPWEKAKKGGAKGKGKGKGGSGGKKKQRKGGGGR